MSDRPALRVIQIDDPCPLPVNAISQSERAPFCSHCQKPVHNLSAMHADEVERLMCRSAGRLCVQFQQTPDGAVRTLDYASNTGPRRRPAIWIWAIGGTLAALFGWGVKGSFSTVRGGVTCRPPSMPGTPTAALATPTTVPTTNPADEEGGPRAPDSQ